MWWRGCSNLALETHTQSKKCWSDGIFFFFFSVSDVGVQEVMAVFSELHHHSSPFLQMEPFLVHSWTRNQCFPLPPLHPLLPLWSPPPLATLDPFTTCSAHLSIRCPLHGEFPLYPSDLPWLWRAAAVLWTPRAHWPCWWASSLLLFSTSPLEASRDWCQSWCTPPSQSSTTPGRTTSTPTSVTLERCLPSPGTPALEQPLQDFLSETASSPRRCWVSWETWNTSAGQNYSSNRVYSFLQWDPCPSISPLLSLWMRSDRGTRWCYRGDVTGLRTVSPTTTLL